MNTDATHKFRLYIAGEAMNSTQALANLEALCREQLGSHYLIEVVDVVREPERARSDAILMTPTLLRIAPSPMRKIVGTLNDKATLMQALDLPLKTQTSDLPPLDGLPT